MTIAQFLLAALLALPANVAIAAAKPSPLHGTERKGPAEREGEENPATPLVLSGGDTIVYRPAFFASARPSNALDMVQLVPGFAIRGGSFGRGLEDRATNVLIDGRQLPAKGDPISSTLARIPASSVVAIVRFRGTPVGIDMAGFSEVLSVIRFPRNDTGATVALSAGRSASVDNQSASFTGTHGRPGRSGSASLNGNRSDNASRAQLTRDGGGVEDVESDSQTELASGNVGIDLALGADTTLRTYVSYSDSTSKSTQGRAIAEIPTLDVASNFDTKSHKISTRIDRRHTNELSTSIDAVHNTTRTTSDSISISGSDQTTFASSYDTSETAAGVTTRYRPEGPWVLEGGIDYALNQFENLTALGINGAPSPLPGSDILVSEHRYGTVFKVTHTPAGGWSTTARLRVDHARIAGERALDDSRSFTDLKPELSLQGRVSDKTRLDIRLAREVDQLSFAAFTASANLSDDTVILGNPELDPERRWVVEASLHRPIFDVGELTVTGRGEHTDNPTELVRTSSGFDALDNVETGLAARLSAQLALPLNIVGLDNVRLDLNATLGTSHLTDPTTGDTRRQSSDIRHSWSARLRHTLDDLPLSYGFTAAGSESTPTFSPAEIKEVTSSPTLSGYIEYDFTKNLSLRADITYTGSSTTDRRLYSDTRATGTLIERQVQTYPSVTGAQLTLKWEI